MHNQPIGSGGRLDGMMLWISEEHAVTHHLTTVQIGAKHLLDMAIYRNGGYLPNDEKRLARIAKLTLDKWRKVGPDVMELYEVDGDRITSVKLRQSLEKAIGLIEKRRAAGESRWASKSLKDNNPVHALASAEHEQTTPNAPETKTHNKKEEEDREPRKARTHTAKTILPDDWKPSEVDIAFAREQGLTDSEIKRDEIKFRNYFGTEHRVKRASWSKTWENWVLTTAGGKRRQSAPSRQPADAMVVDAIGNAIARARHRCDDNVVNLDAHRVEAA
jgi:uncharacterized protein YdaU (DUF1376 family)